MHEWVCLILSSICCGPIANLTSLVTGHQFINWFYNWSVFELVGPLSIIQSEVVPFRNQAERLTSSSNSMKAVQTCQTNSLWPEWHESWLNDLLKHTSKVVLQARPNQHQRGLDTESNLRWCWLSLLARLTSKAKTNMKMN